MAIGKNKRISKSRKGGKKKVGDPFLKKEWYDLKAPPTFSVRTFGKTIATKSAGTKLAVDSLKGRVFEVNLNDLNKEEEGGYRKIRLCCEEVQGRNCLTDFSGMDMTRNHLCSLIRKWHSLIEAHAVVRTSDGYKLRIFAIGFTQRRREQVKSTCYVKTSKAKRIRETMVKVMIAEASRLTMRELVKKFCVQMIEKAIDKATRSLFTLQNIYIRKVKVLQKPKLDIGKFLEMHGSSVDAVPIVPEAAEAQNILTAEIAASAAP